MTTHRTFLTAVSGFALAWATSAGAVTAADPSAATFVDPLDLPARLSPRALKAPYFGLQRLGPQQVVAVGPRGHVLRSEDGGQHWSQQPAPVSSDLVDVNFPTPTQGWAVGHDGVVLRSDDAGKTWQRVMDGRSVGQAMVKAYEARAAAGDTGLAKALEDARRMAEDGPARPFLSVHFRDAQEGWLVGQFNLILHTVDGGKTWEPWLDRTENPQGYSLHAIRRAGGQIYIVGELGLMLRLDGASGKFLQLKTPYAGSWFAVTGDARCVVALGMRGNAWRSCDAGVSWTQIQTHTTSAINAGVVTTDGRIVLVTQEGRVLVGPVEAPDVAALPELPGIGNLYGLASMGDGRLMLAGQQGLKTLQLPAEGRASAATAPTEPSAAAR